MVCEAVHARLLAHQGAVTMAILGRRHWYRYDAGDGSSYKIRTLDYLAEAAGLELNDSLPELPPRYEPTYIWLQEVAPTPGSPPLRKKLVIQAKDIPRFLQNPVVEVAGLKMQMKSYVGEKVRGSGRNHAPISSVKVQRVTGSDSE